MDTPWLLRGWAGTARWMRTALVALVVGWATARATAQSITPQIYYATDFEVSEGYNPDLTLVGQQNWLGSGSGGNGIVTNFFDGLGNAAYVGYFPPGTNDESLSVFRQLDYHPDPNHPALVTFSTWMQIEDSQATTNRDDFRWSIYNNEGNRLFTLNFDNASLLVSYQLDDTNGFIPTGKTFTNDVAYEVVITMNFARNLWSAAANGANLVNSKPISTKFNTALNLGDVDAVWFTQDPRHPGDNYMVFDQYQVTVSALSSIPPTLVGVTRLEDGRFLVRLLGEPGLKYLIEASPDLRNWGALQTITAPASGTIDLLDETSTNAPSRFYRAREVAQ
ncbi:MAG TPA: hypothetical protein VHH73_07055 [Verrucomicrobiae bacterium]|nr:hypothetical protein [Verrucomicrobiae bacterium]